LSNENAGGPALACEPVSIRHRRVQPQLYRSWGPEAHREQTWNDLSTFDCPALLFGSVPLDGSVQPVTATLISLSDEPISAGAQFAGLGVASLRRKSAV